MSRAADAKNQKANQKAALADKRDRKAELLALGLNSTTKKLIGEDVLLCTGCGATKLGHGGDPKVPEECLTKCICPGGVQRPVPESDEWWTMLIAAGQARHVVVQAAQRAENALKQGAVAADRGKRKDAKADNELAELDAEYDGIDGVEMAQKVELFPGAKPGLDLEKKCVSKVVEGGQAEEQGVKVGWVVEKVNSVSLSGVKGEEAKKKILVEITKSFKAKEKVVLKMRGPISEEAGGYGYCHMCDKFLEQKEFSAEELEKGEGRRMCWQCGETADMFGDDDE
mmetsp:Transcript_62943/g.184552  ORF Transcript_62943/g.184552 Transcript_62943/m.184552 type:complete len:284 (-) Transcript_62943:59-910(-)